MRIKKFRFIIPPERQLISCQYISIQVAAVNDILRRSMSDMASPIIQLMSVTKNY